MVKKGMGIAMCVVGILSLACVAAAGDLMQWYPRTPAGGASPGLLPSLLNQAAAVEYGPSATIGFAITGDSRQENVLENRSSSTERVFVFANDEKTLIQETVNDQELVQKQESVIIRSK